MFALAALGALSMASAPSLSPARNVTPVVATGTIRGGAEWQDLRHESSIIYVGYRGSLQSAAAKRESAGDVAGAEAVWRVGLQKAKAKDEATEAAEGLADFLARHQRPADAVAVYRELIVKAAKEDLDGFIATTFLSRIAKIYFVAGDPQNGNAILNDLAPRANDIAATSPMQLGEIVATFENAGRYEEAEAWRRKSLAAMKTLYANLPVPAGALAGLRDEMQFELAENLLLQRKYTPEILPSLHRSVSDWRVRQEHVFGQPEQALTEPGGHGEGREILGALAAADWLAAGAGGSASGVDYQAEAFVAVQEMMHDEATEALMQAAARKAAQQQAGLGALARKRQALSDQWLALFNAKSMLLATGGQGLPAGFADLARQQAETETAIKAADQAMTSKFPKFFAMIHPTALSVAQAKTLLAPDEAVLLIEPSRYGTTLLAITREGLLWRFSNLTDRKLDAMVAKLRQDLDPTAEGVANGLPGYDIKTAYALYAELIAPVNAAIATKSHLFIAADGALTSLPMGVLVTRPPTADDDGSNPLTLQDLPWFADAHALIQIPSLQSLAFLRTFVAHPAAGADKTNRARFAGYGDPLLAGRATSRGARGGELHTQYAMQLVGQGVTDIGAPLMDVDRLRKLHQLPGTRAELEKVRELLGAPETSLRVGGAMTEHAFKADSSAGRLSHTRVLDIATHGLTAGESGSSAEPGLVFTPPIRGTSDDDGYLGASEVVGLDLAGTEWVILSACNSASPSGRAGAAGLSGLVRAFFFAGAPTLLVSHWPVFDSVAAELTAGAIRHQAKQPGMSRAQALQAAMHDVRADFQFAHPSAWAPFSLVGER